MMEGGGLLIVQNLLSMIKLFVDDPLLFKSYFLIN